ncbi:fam-l protein [Plasmodium malariae]|uniref:Fam-l protein n=1 Tax=Plasmodium malariae TaxID=5858 RepID=A0A1D3JHB9_PLAMA|nr:fam-l protein [Plasmodium malariae]SBT85732.1 fam-l protein [Plasmodium malariae]
MQYKYNLIFFIKIATFILSPWIFHFYNGCILNKYGEKINILCSKLEIRTYRLLIQSKHNKDSIIIGLGEVIPNNVVTEQYYINDNGKGNKEINKQLRESTSKSAKCYETATKKKSCVFETKNYSRLEKKIFKQLDYENFLKNNKIIGDKMYKKIIRRKYGLKLASPLILSLILSIALILDLFGGYGFIRALFKLFTALSALNGLKPFYSFLMRTPLKSLVTPIRQGSTSGSSGDYYAVLDLFFFNVIYVLPLIILGVTTISGIFYYHKKVKKYESIKFRKR